MMNAKEFCDKYKALGGVLSGHFYDSVDEETDESLAERIVTKDLPHPESARRLVRDSEGVLRNIENEWQALGATANRHFETAEEARLWLSSVYAVWDAIVRRRDDSKPS